MNNNFAPPSLQLGMVGNCAFSALIDRQARMVWCCLPRFDGDPVFNALLDPSENGSHWAFELEDFERSEQEYEPNTAVLRTRLYDRRGQGIEVTDFAPRFWSRGRMFRPLTLIRRVRVLQGSPRMRVLLKPRFDWGRLQPQVTQGSTHIRFVGPAQTLRVNCDAPISYILAETFFVVDRPMNFIMGPDETLATGIEDTARHFEQETISYWKSWTRALALPLEWQEAVIRAAITLKLSLFEDTGAIVATSEMEFSARTTKKASRSQQKR
jgi:GH15 family glucan-1,4-alpha-glucosidase